MNNNNQKYLIEEVKKIVNIFDQYNDFRRAYEYYKELKQYLEAEKIKQFNPELYNKYCHYLVKLKFLSLNFFDDWHEIEDLLKNHFDAIYGMKYYDLWDKIKLNLMAVIDLDQRDKIKENLKKALLSCQGKVVALKKYGHYQNFPITVESWLNDYNANLGIGEVDNLKRIQYLTKSENFTKLDEEDRNKLKVLFDLYEKLKISSNTPHGYENDIPMFVNNKFIIFSGGEAEEIGSDIFNLIKSIKTNDDKNTIIDDKQKQNTREQAEEDKQNFKGSLEQKALQEEKERENKIDELAGMASRFPVGSLERKAVEEELRKYK